MFQGFWDLGFQGLGFAWFVQVELARISHHRSDPRHRLFVGLCVKISGSRQPQQYEDLTPIYQIKIQYEIVPLHEDCTKTSKNIPTNQGNLTTVSVGRKCLGTQKKNEELPRLKQPVLQCHRFAPNKREGFQSSKVEGCVYLRCLTSISPMPSPTHVTSYFCCKLQQKLWS